MSDLLIPANGVPTPEKVVTVLAISDSVEDHDWLAGIFNRTNWRLLSAHACRDAFEILESRCIPVVLCECALPDGSWKSLLNRFNLSADSPLLIVMSRQADDRLWAEVLNLGGYDVLSKPFDHSEVVRVISAAWLHWRQRRIARAAHQAEAAVELRATA